MAEPWPFVRVLIILMTCFPLFHRSSQAALAPTTPAGILCIPRERDALRDFKTGLNDSGNILSSWRGADCCRWKGVVCSNRTGHVIALRINSRPISEDVAPQVNSRRYAYPFGTMGGEIRSSLLSLRHLKQLDLSYNNFSGQPIPELIGALRSLTHLGLSNSNFGGRIPPHIGNLSNLLSLQLNSYTDIQVRTHSHDLAWVSRLRKLQVLSMPWVDLSAAVDWFQAVSMLPGLIHLDLGSCGLQNTMPPPLHANLTSLESLDLQYNPFNTSLVAKNLGLLWDLPSLQVLSLSGCGIHGPIPDVVGNLTSLQTLDLYSNHFTGMVPLTFRKLKKLQCLDLSYNFFNMDVRKLLHLLPSNELQMLLLSYNSFTGSLPDWIGRFSSLNMLYLDYNKLAGEIPVGIRELRNLTELWLDSNNLHGTITEDHFTNLTTLEHLWVSHNSLTVKVNSTWYTPFRLMSAGFSSCILGPQFPAWLIQPTMEALDISNTSIHDNIPAEFWTASPRWALDMSSNRLVGMLPKTLGDLELETLDISSNELTGPIPTLPKTLHYLDLSNNNLSGPLPSGTEGLVLQSLLLFNNSLSGTIPCSLLQLQLLESLDLSNNLLHGTIPKCPQGYITSSITTLNLNRNNLSGPLPMFLQRCRNLILLDLAYNKFSGSLPAWIGSRLPQLALLRLRSNKFSGGIHGELSKMKGLQFLDIACNNISGNIPESFGNLTAMTLGPNASGALFNLFHNGLFDYAIPPYYYTDSLLVDTKGQELEYTSGITYMVNIDLSCNGLTGQIPSEIGMLVALKSLNLSWNNVSGIMPQSIGELRALESFDLSHNELSGEIPISLSALTSLSRLNLSYNNLTGTIPSGNQLRTLDDQASIYIGNPGLCGPPLTRSCSGIDKTTLIPKEHEGMSDMVSFYLSLCLGFVVGLWIVFCGFLFKRKWRVACFSFSDHIYDRVYVEVHVGWASLARKFR
ncbi:receptor-like protein EIX1 [Lolium rigidum]|uniref:receptor-like protein EIX1 n=1 Tax=Lolium rigidum TaxID=89674 RepID=UPI001F5E3420|nr:receptor-like protein EIX1 [Lolium rigidum]